MNWNRLNWNYQLASDINGSNSVVQSSPYHRWSSLDEIYEMGMVLEDLRFDLFPMSWEQPELEPSESAIGTEPLEPELAQA